jgi:hypothetical protein
LLTKPISITILELLEQLRNKMRYQADAYLHWHYCHLPLLHTPTKLHGKIWRLSVEQK